MAEEDDIVIEAIKLGGPLLITKIQKFSRDSNKVEQDSFSCTKKEEITSLENYKQSVSLTRVKFE